MLCGKRRGTRDKENQKQVHTFVWEMIARCKICNPYLRTHIHIRFLGRLDDELGLKSARLRHGILAHGTCSMAAFRCARSSASSCSTASKFDESLLARRWLSLVSDCIASSACRAASLWSCRLCRECDVSPNLSLGKCMHAQTQPPSLSLSLATAPRPNANTSHA